ncbi:MAG: glutamate racemase [Defluviitaleaceae bacterium]|nr:glutamate racemase [Defluviitaleaceae bacterium]
MRITTPSVIGVIDSGLGGLTVLRALRAVMPDTRFLYYGDTAHAPYGGRSPHELLSFGREIVAFLLGKGATSIVLACGSLSSTAYDTLCTEFPHVPITDVLRPGVAAVRAIDPPRLGIIATAATIRSRFFENLLRADNPNRTILTRACPLFAPLAEKGIFDGTPVQWAAEHYLQDWRGKIDALVLGCTHYPLLLDPLRDTLPNVQMIDLSESTAATIKQTSQGGTANGITINNVTTGGVTYYTSGNPEPFARCAAKILSEACDVLKA